MRVAFVTLGQDKDFIRDYASAVKTDPLVVPGAEAQETSPRSEGEARNQGVRHRLHRTSW